MTPHYVTHFDKGYLARGILMLESLIRHASDAKITVIHHDDTVRRVIQEELGDRINLVDQKSIVRRFPVLNRLKAQRAPWAFYATLKPALILYVVETFVEKGEWAASIDADTFFYSEPTPAYENLNNAEVVITPHRFSAEMPADIGMKYGRFNAGFILFQNTAGGRRCLQDWLRNCVTQCGMSEAGSQFMNQGYLDKWPTDYPFVLILDIPTVNLAFWNLASHQITDGQTGPLVDGQPLIFFHFSDHRRVAPGKWQRQDQPSLHTPEVDALIYQPMEAVLDAKIAEFEEKYQAAGPQSLKSVTQPLTAPGLADRLKQTGFRGILEYLRGK